MVDKCSQIPPPIKHVKCAQFQCRCIQLLTFVIGMHVKRIINYTLLSPNYYIHDYQTVALTWMLHHATCSPLQSPFYFLYPKPEKGLKLYWLSVGLNGVIYPRRHRHELPVPVPNRRFGSQPNWTSMIAYLTQLVPMPICNTRASCLIHW